MTPSELLERIAATLKTEVGPAVGEEYPRSQAYFSAVVLKKIAAQLHLADAHAAAEGRDRLALGHDLKRLLDDKTVSSPLNSALAALVTDGDAGVCRFIEALYAERKALGDESFEALLARVRKDMRAAIDRRAEYAS